jgi:hypothetical protein
VCAARLEDVQWQNRASFFDLAARRDGGELRVWLRNAADETTSHSGYRIAPDDALATLLGVNPRHRRVVEPRISGGPSLKGIAHVLCRAGTVRRDWR